MRHTRLLAAGAALAALAAGWALLGRAGSAPTPARQGVVTVTAGPSSAPPTSAPHGLLAIGAAPAEVEAQVRQAYPLLRDVAFGCDARGCAVTATIPPPTDDAFLATRQAMLLGGLAHTVEGLGYAATGPVQMDEVSKNLFHIRLPVAEGRPRG